MRVVVEMDHPDHGSWFIDFGDVDGPPGVEASGKELRDIARKKAEGMSEGNGGGWKFKSFHDRLPHEGEE